MLALEATTQQDFFLPSINRQSVVCSLLHANARCCGSLCFRVTADGSTQHSLGLVTANICAQQHACAEPSETAIGSTRAKAATVGHLRLREEQTSPDIAWVDNE